MHALGADGSHLLHRCFDKSTEYDTDVIFDKNTIFSVFCSKCSFFMKPNCIQVLIKMLKARIKLIILFESRVFDLYFDVLHVQYITSAMKSL